MWDHDSTHDAIMDCIQKIYDSFIFILTSEKMNDIINVSLKKFRANFLGGR